MRGCTGILTTLDLSGIAAIHSLWLISGLCLIAELLFLRIRTPRHRMLVGMSILLLIPPLMAALFAAIQWRWINILPTWGVQSLFGWKLTTWITAIALTGVLVRAAMLVVSFLAVTMLRHKSISLPTDLGNSLVPAQGSPEVRVTSIRWLHGPVTIGWWTPLILIPQHCLSRLSPAQIKILIAHESAHVRSNDFLSNLVQAVVEVFVFYHPAVWLLSRHIRKEREFSCDDQVLAAGFDRLEYASALACLERSRTRFSLLLQSCNGAPLLSRIQRILQNPDQRKVPVFRLLMLAGLTGLGAVASTGMRTTQAENSGVFNMTTPVSFDQFAEIQVLCCPE